MVWNKTVPTSATYIINIPGVFHPNWTLCEDIKGVQHYTYTSSLSGRHKPGITGIIYANTTSNIAGLTSPQSGALAYDTTLGLLKRYNGSAWVQANLDPMAHTLAYRNGDQTIGKTDDPTVFTLLEYNTETKDPLGCFSTFLSRFTPKTNGYYLIVPRVVVTPTAGGILFRIAASIKITGASTTVGSSIFYQYCLSTDSLRLGEPLVFYIETTQYLEIGINHDSETSQVVEGGSDFTTLSIYKIS